MFNRKLKLVSLIKYLNLSKSKARDMYGKIKAKPMKSNNPENINRTIILRIFKGVAFKVREICFKKFKIFIILFL